MNRIRDRPEGLLCFLTGDGDPATVTSRLALGELEDLCPAT
jgi:hypothetical protein